jgi:1-acyl-sn-glycerol-3-phosphate acyltransferase
MREKQLSENTEEIMCRIAAQLPESHRGIYADHPRLSELLAINANQQPHTPLVAG